METDTLRDRFNDVVCVQCFIIIPQLYLSSGAFSFFAQSPMGISERGAGLGGNLYE